MKTSDELLLVSFRLVCSYALEKKMKARSNELLLVLLLLFVLFRLAC
jgi:hypothetical protein